MKAGSAARRTAEGAASNPVVPASSSIGPSRNRWPWRRTGFLSPLDLLARAVVLSALFGLAHLAGLREHTTFLSGTLADPRMAWGWAAFLGCTYLVLYFAFVLLVPILLLAAVLSLAIHRLSLRCTR